MHVSHRIQSLPAYVFAAIDEARDALTKQGIEPIDFGVGDHTRPSPEIARERVKTAVDEFATAGYPSYVGSGAYREACAAWMQRRFGVTLDPATEICSSIGSKEAVFHMPLAFIDPGDTVLVPTPGYPPYSRGTLFAGGKTHYLPLTPEKGWLIDFDAIPNEVAQAAKMLWICYPNSPTGVQGNRDFLEQAVRFCRDHDILLVSDEAYTEIYFDEANKSHSALEVEKKGVLVVQSMSKRSMMTGWRIGWVCGDPEAVAVFKKLKTNIDSGTPDFIQAGAIAALEDETHVAEMRTAIKQARDVLAEGLVAAGLPDCRPESTLYLWQRVPDGMSSVDFAKRLLQPDLALVCTPGEWISDATAEGYNPGATYCRFALVATPEQTKEAARRLAQVSLVGG